MCREILWYTETCYYGEEHAEPYPNPKYHLCPNGSKHGNRYYPCRTDLPVVYEKRSGETCPQCQRPIQPQPRNWANEATQYVSEFHRATGNDEIPLAYGFTMDLPRQFPGHPEPPRRARKQQRRPRSPRAPPSRPLSPFQSTGDASFSQETGAFYDDTGKRIPPPTKDEHPNRAAFNQYLRTHEAAIRNAPSFNADKEKRLNDLR